MLTLCVDVGYSVRVYSFRVTMYVAISSSNEVGPGLDDNPQLPCNHVLDFSVNTLNGVASPSGPNETFIVEKGASHLLPFLKVDRLLGKPLNTTASIRLSP